MSITQKVEKCYKYQVENIKNEKNHNVKIKMIGALVLDVGGRCISAIAKALNASRKFVKKCKDIVENNLDIISNRHNCGRKKVTEIYPELEQDIHSIMENNTYTDPHYETETQYCKLSIDEVYAKLLELGKYSEKFISRSSLATLLNVLGYDLKEVERSKPLKKIDETDVIFENVKEKKEEAIKDDKCALISIDTKDKVLLGPFSRRGKSRVKVDGCDHNLTNKCVIPFGILDIKNSQPYFYNFTHKPTSIAMVECLEDYVQNNSKYKKISVLLDNGPDNSGVRTAFLKSLVDLVNKYQIEIELIFYPPYCSKYNPVERLWARLEKKWNGMMLLSKDICNKVMEELTWKSHLAKVKSIEKEYEKGITYTKDEMSLYDANIIRNPNLKKWSIRIVPTVS